MKKLLILLMLLSINTAYASQALLITSTSQLLNGSNAFGAVGDYLLSNDSVKIIITDISHNLSPGNTGGQLVDAALIGGTDDFDLFYLYLNDQWPRQGNYSSLDIISSGSPEDSAHIRVRGVDSYNSNISIATDYILYDNTTSLKTVTSFKNNGTSTISNYGVGDAFSWGSNPFIPGGSSSSDWLASRTTNTLYGYYASSIFNALHGSYWSDVTLEEISLSPGDSAKIIRYFCVGNSLQDIYLTVMNSKDITPGTVLGNVSANGNPVENALVSFIKEYDSGPSFEIKTDPNGDYLAKLEPGNWTCNAVVLSQSKEQNIQIHASTQTIANFTFNEVSPVNYTKDTLTIIQSPLINIPLFVLPGETFKVEIYLPESESVLSLSLLINGHKTALSFSELEIPSEFGLRTLEAVLPDTILYGLYDIELTSTGTDSMDISEQAVCVIPDYKKEFTFIQVTDTHLPSHYYWGDSGLEDDSTEIVDFREVIKDINIINPDFVIHTGDFINDGEIEYLGIPSYSRAKKQLHELDVPLFLVAGNHDLGGWDATPAPDGTSRRTWWKYFGWQYLNNTSPTATTTQNYSFNYDKSHFIGLEAYDNYDEWRYDLYGSKSFISSQFTWLSQDLAEHADDSLKVLFYHYDFKHELDLNTLGIDAAFWGHVHGNNEDSSYPYSISTGATCDGHRWYRIIKVRNNEIIFNEAVQAGYSGENLTLTFSDNNTAQIINNFNFELNDCLIKFDLPENHAFKSLSNASLFQIDSLSEPKFIYALADIPGNSTLEVTLQTEILTASANYIPDKYFTMDIYPNPFNPETVVNYELSNSGKVNIDVFNIWGKKITTLMSKVQHPGNYKLTWNADDQPSGLYFIKAEIKNTSGNFQSVKKCLLMK